MAIFKSLDDGQVGLIIQDENGTISQLGLTEDQSKILNVLVAKMSESKPLIKLPEEYNLFLKESKIENKPFCSVCGEHCKDGFDVGSYDETGMCEKCRAEKGE